MKLFSQGWSERKDGPGFRRIYYLKGCNLRCRWCASPESISAEPQLLFHPDRLSDFPADALCPHGAICNAGLDRDICAGCRMHECRMYKHPALEWVGREVSADDLFNEILRFRDSWPNMAGVTFGGGEPTLQAEELIPLLERLNDASVHTAFESNATTPFFLDVARKASFVISDLKAAHDDVFKYCTGGNLPDVLNNLQSAAASIPDFLIRVPVITGLNDAPGELQAMAVILGGFARIRHEKLKRPLKVEVLKLHHFGQPKYQALGWNYQLAGVPEPDPARISEFLKALNDAGVCAEHAN